MDRETEFKSDDIETQEPSPDASSKSSELFEQGDELFSRGLFHQAVHVWTRILFLDRGNAEARLRIDKAKEAVAERQRQIDAEVGEARLLFDSGEIEGARERVRSVLAFDGRHGEASALAAAIEALDRRSEQVEETPPEPEAAPVPEKAPASKGVVFKVPKGRRASPRLRAHAAGSKLSMSAFVAAALLIFGLSAFYLSRNWDTIVGGGTLGRGSGETKAALPDSLGASAPDLSEIRYYNGERLFAQARYREALAELRRVDRDSRVVAEARSLILRIEDRLLRGPTETEEDTDAAR